MFLRQVLLSIILLLGVNAVYAQNLEYGVELDTNYMLIGDQQRLTFKVRSDEEARILFPQLKDTVVNGVEIISGPRRDSVWEKDGKWVPGFTVDQVEKVFQLYYDMMFVDKSVPPYSIGWEWEELDPNFASGTIAMVQDGSWIQQRMPDGVKPETWKTADFPYYSTPATYMEVKVEGVGAFSEHKEEALDFLMWLYNRDNMVAITQTDNLPSRSDSVESPLWVADPVWKDEFVENAQYGFTIPSIPMVSIFEQTMAFLQEVLYERMTPREAAEGFHAFVAEYLDSEVNA